MQALRDQLNVTLKLSLWPKLNLTSNPLNSYYRFAFDRESSSRSVPFVGLSQLDLHSSLLFRVVPFNSAQATFSELAGMRVLQAAIDPPSLWFVETFDTEHDLDNIRVPPDTYIWAELRLKHFVVEGHCFPVNEYMPPAGLELQIHDRQGTQHSDTIVMKNLGYFQLKAVPALYTLSLVAGRSSELYDLVEIVSYRKRYTTETISPKSKLLIPMTGLHEGDRYLFVSVSLLWTVCSWILLPRLTGVVALHRSGRRPRGWENHSL